MGFLTVAAYDSIVYKYTLLVSWWLVLKLFTIEVKESWAVKQVVVECIHEIFLLLGHLFKMFCVL